MHGYFNLVKIKTVYCLVTISVIFVMLYLNNTSYIKKNKVQIPRATLKPFIEPTTDVIKHNIQIPRSKTKYILLWTNPNAYPFVYFGEGNSLFKRKQCDYDNCFVTSNRGLLKDITKYDIVAFNGPQLVGVLGNNDMPKQRSYHQKYVYTNIEAAVTYPVCSNTWDNFFNWTWTYKLNSDAIWGYIAIKNSSGHIIGPNVSIDWMSVDDMNPINEEIKSRLAKKSKAAAWFASNCNTLSNREKYVDKLESYLNLLNLNIDIYGSCGPLQCPKTLMNQCLEQVESDYYFYLAFENAVSADYVTEKILHALNHYAVPIVYGGGDYDRFLPPGSYINAYNVSARDLAQEMNDIIENREVYYRFFRWRKYYSFHLRHESPSSDDYCRFCAMANDEHLMSEYSSYDNFSAWWTPTEICANLLEDNK